MICECRICGRKFYAKREARMYCQHCNDELLKSTKSKKDEFRCTHDSRKRIKEINNKALSHNMTYGQYMGSRYYKEENRYI